MLNKNIEKLLNEQITKEFFSSHLYLSMAAYFADKSLNGYSHWYVIQAQEEREHAMLIYDYILRTGGKVSITGFDSPKTDFESISNALKETLAHEEFITQSIYDIVDAAQQEKDFKTTKFLDWFVNEQVEEEENVTDIIAKYELMGTDGKGLYMLDNELASRVYTPTTSADIQG